MLILLTGAPASGKTSIGKRLAKDLKLPFFSRDGFKEAMFDALGYDDREWSKRIGGASWDIFYAVITEVSKKGQSLVAETNFRPASDEEKIRKIGVPVLQIHCTAPIDVISERFKERVASGERHPGHGDSTTSDEFRRETEVGKFDALELDAPMIAIDTTDFDAIDYEKISKEIASFLQ